VSGAQAPGEPPELELAGLRRRFGATAAVDGLDLRVERGEILTLLGPSGCGKTTALRLIAGFEEPDEGRILFRGDDVTSHAPQRRGFGMVFQNYALFPHLDVYENVAFGLRCRGAEEDEIRGRVARVLELVDLPRHSDRRVQQLSGGQQQRIALARALAIEPPLLLLDEPLSNLDAALRERTRIELRRLIRDVGITALFVTHDQEEAFDLSDRVAVMRAGRIRQLGAPETLYDSPADAFVAGFVGRANRLRIRLASRAGAGRSVRLPGGTVWSLPPDAQPPGHESGTLELWVRPEDLVLVRLEEVGPAPGAGPASTGDLLPGTVRDRRFRGAVTSFRVDAGEAGLLEVTGGRSDAEPGDRVGLAPAPGARLHLFPEPAPETPGWPEEPDDGAAGVE